MQDEVTAVWLSATTNSGRESELFHRKGKEIEFGDFAKFGEESITASKALRALELLGVRPNQLLLNKIIDLACEWRGTLLHQVVRWFTECLVSYPLADQLPREGHWAMLRVRQIGRVKVDFPYFVL